MAFYLTIHIIICVLLTAVILFQDGKAGGLTSVADSSQAVFGAKGAGSFLTKVTSVLSILFFVTSMSLAYFTSDSNESIAADFVPETTPEVEMTTPAEGTSNDLNSNASETEVITEGDQTDAEKTDDKPADQPTEEEKPEGDGNNQ